MFQMNKLEIGIERDISCESVCQPACQGKTLRLVSSQSMAPACSRRANLILAETCFHNGSLFAGSARLLGSSVQLVFKGDTFPMVLTCCQAVLNGRVPGSVTPSTGDPTLMRSLVRLLQLHHVVEGVRIPDPLDL